jgi:dTDP-glucose 4,6-dehydratase
VVSEVFGEQVMKYLVTGGCGFIGSNYILQLMAKTEHEVVNVDCLTYAGRPENLASIENDSRYHFYKVDIRNSKDLSELFEKEQPQVVVHFAAESHVDRSIVDADAFITTNVVGTYNLLEASRQMNVQRLHHVSTDEIYGAIPSPKSSVETDPIEPRSPYSASKASSDLIAMSYFVTHGLPVTISRASNNYGPRQFPEKLIPLFVTNLFEHRKVPVYGDGKQVREWIHVDDHNRAIDFVIAHGKPGQIYNIGSGVSKENIEITKLLLDMMGRDNTYIQYVTDRKGHDRRYSINCSKLMAMGWRPVHSFESGMEETVKWYLNNEGWWRLLKRV